jgi:hypothetical protein
MKKYITIFLLVLIILPTLAEAQIVPCGRSGSGTMCTLCDLIVGIDNIIKYAFNILVWVAVCMIVIAGVMYIVSAGSQGLMNAAKQLLWNVLVGFAIVLLAWLIINTIIITVLNTNYPQATGKNNWTDYIIGADHKCQ